jgi:hypothetical protein
MYGNRERPRAPSTYSTAQTEDFTPEYRLFRMVNGARVEIKVFIEPVEIGEILKHAHCASCGLNIFDAD